jgi:hypothetical protein
VKTKILWAKQTIFWEPCHIEGNILQNHKHKKIVKKSENQDFMGKTNYFLGTLPFSAWAVPAT